MPRTKSTKEDKRTPLEKLMQLDCKINRLIFFEYFDGYKTDGMLGFKVTSKTPVGSAKHWATNDLYQAILTKNQFRSRSKRLALIAKQFTETYEDDPPDELRPRFSNEEIVKMIEELKEDQPSAEEKFRELESQIDFFIFFKYYDGYNTKGETGFSPNSGPPGSVNHKNAYARHLKSISESQFRNKGQKLAKIAKEFVEKGIVPPDNLRPPPIEYVVPLSLLNAATEGGY